MSKKVVICCSKDFSKEAEKVKEILEKKGYKVIRYPKLVDQNSLEEYRNTYVEHYRKINECDILFVLNFDKNGIKKYIGPSVFAEIAFAIGLNIVFNKNIEIYLKNPIPEGLPYSEELKLWEKLGWIKVRDISE